MVVCQSMLCSKMTQLYTYILFFIVFHSIMVYHRIRNRIPCATQKDLVVYPFYMY